MLWIFEKSEILTLKCLEGRISLTEGEIRFKIGQKLDLF